MINKINRQKIRRKRKFRYKHKLTGNKEIPRISVFRSLRHISVQAINDNNGHILTSASTNEKLIAKDLSGKTKGIKAAELVGNTIAKRLKDKKIEAAKFDRNGYIYHGLVKTVAETIRSAGIKI